MTLSPKLWAVIGTGIVILALCIGLLATRAALAEAKTSLVREQAAHQKTEDNYRLAAQQRKTDDLLNVARVDAEADAVSKETIDEYQDRIAALRADFAERVRLAKAEAYPGGSSGKDMPGLPDAAERADEAARQAQLPAQDALIASEQAEQLAALQGWVRRAGAISVNGPQ